MKRILTLLVLVAAVGCQAEAPPDHRKARGPDAPAPECPMLPRELGISMVGQRGPDFWTCIATADATKQALFRVYVGNFPALPGSLGYGGTTTTAHGSLVWFRPMPEAQSRPGEPTPWITFIPTGDRRRSVMMVSLTARPGDISRQADIVAQLRQ
jgi:hypothetical protein